MVDEVFLSHYKPQKNEKHFQIFSISEMDRNLMLQASEKAYFQDNLRSPVKKTLQVRSVRIYSH